MERPSDSIEDRRRNQWAMVESELLRDPTIPPQGKALYGLLITYGPQRIFPGQQTLADCLGTTRQTVIRWLQDLKDRGLIDWDNRTGTSNKYYILGYENLRPVTPALHPCNTHVTPPVTPTLHDPDPVIQIQELEKTADADFWGPAGKPDRKPITTNLPTSARDPLDLAAKTAPARAKEKQWTIPGTDDSWSGKPLQGFCVLAGRTELKDSERKHWPRQLSKWALDWHATPDETYAAIKAIPDSEFHWMTFKTPFAPTFLETLDAMIDRIRNHQPINVKGHRDNGTQADPDLAAQINDYLKQRGAAIATTS